MRTRGRLQVAPAVFFKACLLGAQEGIGDGDQADMMVPAQPLAAFVMVQPQFCFPFTIVLFNPPAGLGGADQTAQSPWLSPELGQPVLGGFSLV